MKVKFIENHSKDWNNYILYKIQAKNSKDYVCDTGRKDRIQCTESTLNLIGHTVRSRIKSWLFSFYSTQEVQNNCDKAFGNMWQSSFLWLSQGLNPLAPQHSVHFRRGSVPEFILWNDRLWQSAILQRFRHIVTVLWGHWIMIREQFLTISMRKKTAIKYQFITHFVSSGRWPCTRADGAWRGEKL